MTAWHQFKRDRGAKVASATLILLSCVALFADCLASDLPIVLRLDGTLHLFPNISRPPALLSLDNQTLRKQFSQGRGWAVMPLCEYGSEQQPEIVKPPPAAPDALHWLGTDDRGRDLFARLVHGTRVSLVVGFLSVVLYLLMGVPLGLVAGFYGGRVDWVVARLIEIGLTFPTFFLIVIIMALLERSSVTTISVVLALTRWPTIARLVRAEALRVREMDYVAASRVAGVRPVKTLLRHLLPNVLGPVWVNIPFGVGGAILVESALTFLGFGTAPPTASWGEILSQAFQHQNLWWLTLPPGVLLFGTIASLNGLGGSLRRALDPRPTLL